MEMCCIEKYGLAYLYDQYGCSQYQRAINHVIMYITITILTISEHVRSSGYMWLLYTGQERISPTSHLGLHKGNIPLICSLKRDTFSSWGNTGDQSSHNYILFGYYWSRYIFKSNILYSFLHFLKRKVNWLIKFWHRLEILDIAGINTCLYI